MSDRLWAWFTVDPNRYWLVAAPFGFALLAATILPRRIAPWIFVLVLAATLFAYRWPVVAYGGELNRDESQMIAGAMTLRAAPVYWRDVDGHAIGPLDVYPLAWLGSLGFPMTYVTARGLGLFLNWIALLGLYRLMRDAHGEALARAATIVAAGFYCLMRQADLTGYSSETMAAALASIGSTELWIGARRGTVRSVFLGSLALGAVGWGKLQGVPPALAFGICAFVYLWKNWAPEPVRRRRLMLWGGAGCLVVTAAFALMLTAHGLWSEWATDYILAGVNYTGSATHPMIEALAFFFASIPLGFYSFGLPLLAVIVLLLGSILFHGSAGRPLAIALGCSLVGALVAVALPGRLFPHYLVLVVVPLTGLAASLLGAQLEQIAAGGGLTRRPWLAPAGIAAFLAVTLVPQLDHTSDDDAPQYIFPAGINHLMPSRAAVIMKRLAGPRDTLAMWGWEPSQYVQSGLAQATREAHTERLIEDNKLKPYYRARYLADLKRSAPLFFIDAVGPNRFRFSDRALEGHEIWPELNAWIAANYRLVDDTESLRLYVANRAIPAG